MLNNSRDIFQEVSFDNEPLKVIVRSARDPHTIFKKLTLGKEKIDEEPRRQLIGGIIMLSFASCLMVGALWRCYRFLVDRVLRRYLASKRAEKYLVKQEFERPKENHFPLDEGK